MQHPAQTLEGLKSLYEDRVSLDPAKARKDLPVLLSVHEAIKAALEEARTAKALGSSLESGILITAEDSGVYNTLSDWRGELATIFVVSSVTIQPRRGHGATEERRGLGFKSPMTRIWIEGATQNDVEVEAPEHAKCSRCWRYLAPVEDGLCKRCEDVVGNH